MPHRVLRLIPLCLSSQQSARSRSHIFLNPEKPPLPLLNSRDIHTGGRSASLSLSAQHQLVWSPQTISSPSSLRKPLSRYFILVACTLAEISAHPVFRRDLPQVCSPVHISVSFRRRRSTAHGVSPSLQRMSPPPLSPRYTMTLGYGSGVSFGPEEQFPPIDPAVFLTSPTRARRALAPPPPEGHGWRARHFSRWESLMDKYECESIGGNTIPIDDVGVIH